MSNVAAPDASGSGTCVQVFEGWEVLAEDALEPRVRDVDLAVRAGLAQPRNIRTTIAANSEEILAHGPFCTRLVQNGERGRPSKEYWLNEGQAIALVSRLETPKAREVRVALVKVFVAWRRGELERLSESRGQKALSSPRRRRARVRARAESAVDYVHPPLNDLDAVSHEIASYALGVERVRDAGALSALARTLADLLVIARVVDAVDAQLIFESTAKDLRHMLRRRVPEAAPEAATETGMVVAPVT